MLPALGGIGGRPASSTRFPKRSISASVSVSAGKKSPSLTHRIDQHYACYAAAIAYGNLLPPSHQGPLPYGIPQIHFFQSFEVRITPFRIESNSSGNSLLPEPCAHGANK